MNIEHLEQLERDHYVALAAVYRKLAEIKSPRLRAMVKAIRLHGMHAGDPPDLEEYAAATGSCVIDAADELSAAGGFTETDKGIVTGEIHFEGDLPEEPDDDDDDDEDDFYIYKVEI